MPSTPFTHRPQTLKQAKKAYRKSGGAVRLSESEKAILERRAVLQERADRIKEREARRKANLKRKEERLQREREARHRMGIPTPPTKERIQVGPSQLHLSGFMYAGEKRKSNDEIEEEEKEAGTRKQEELLVQEQQERPIEPARSPQPLQTFSANANPTWMMPSQVVNANPPKVRDFAPQGNRTSPGGTRPARNPLQAKSANPTIQPKPSAGHQYIYGLQHKASYLQKPQTSPMDQPPLRTPVQATDTRSTVFQKPPLIPLPSKAESIPEDNFDDFFVSNTQIQRELSPPLTPPARPTSHAIPTTRPPTPPMPASPFNLPPANEDTANLLAFLSTQDLDFSLDPTQIRPTAPPNEPDEPKISPAEEEEDEEEEEEGEEEDFPDAELEDIVLEFSLDSPIITSSPSNNAPTTPHEQLLPETDPPAQSDGDGGTRYDSDDAEMQASLQTASKAHEREAQCQEAQRAAEWDAFELSTQDLIELES